MLWSLVIVALGGTFSTAIATATSGSCVGINAVSSSCKSNETAMVRDFFYIGGEYVFEEAFNSSIFSDQMYVEKLAPASGVTQKFPIVFVSAGIPAGNVWLNTPDNREGWASYFVKLGYLIYIVDITSVGRSSQEDLAKYPMSVGTTVEITEDDFTDPQRIDPYPQSVNHTQWPGSGTQGDPYFDAFDASILPLTSNATSQELSMRAAGCKLLQMIGGQSYVLSHSAGATYATLMADQCPTLMKGSINIEPGNVPFENLIGNATVPAVGSSPARPCGLTTTILDYSPPITSCSQLKTTVVGKDTPGNRSCILQASPIHKLPNLAKVPYVALTGAASPHITYDHCIIDYLNQAGVVTEWIKLGDLGIEGNGHFMYLEKNNLAIAAVVEQWIVQNNKAPLTTSKVV